MGHDFMFKAVPVFAGCFMLVFAVSFVFVVVTTILSIVRGSTRHKDRLRQLAAWAYQKDLRFNPERELNFRAPLKEFPQLPAGEREHYADNVMRGTDSGRDAICCDYHYVTTSRDKDGKTNTTHHAYSVVLIDAGMSLKKLSIRPEHVFDKVGAFFGYDDIDFESAEFSRTYCVKSEDRKWAYDVIHTKTMEYMLARPKYVTQLLGNHVLVCDYRLWDADEFDRALRYAQGWIDLIPPSVVDELKGVDR